MAKFEKGNAGGPGRPRGWRSATNRALDQLASEGAAAVLKKQLEMAQAGDGRAAELVLKRTWSQPRGRFVEFEMPDVIEAPDVVHALDAVATAVKSGQLTPEEGAAVAEIVEKQRRAIELATLEDRMRALEADLRRLPKL
jgi:hypothetical protein